MRHLDPEAALVLFSGGQDSATALAWALDKYASVETVGFDYGQRHDVELEARRAVRREFTHKLPRLAERLGADELIDLRGLGQVSDTALTRKAQILIGESGLPTTFVPGRNLIFLAMAAAVAYRRGAGVLVAGMCEVDFSGYPDCRREALDAQMRAIALGMEASFDLQTPLMHMSKAQTWFLAEELGGQTLVEIVLEHSHSCYVGERAKRFDWGYGCGLCPACQLRAKGFNAYIAAKSCRKAV